MMKHNAFFIAIMLAALLSHPSLSDGQGRIIIIGDEWLLSEYAFANSPDQTNQLAENIANYFSSGSSSSFLAASSSIPTSIGPRGVNGPALAAKMQSLGHDWLIDPAPEISFDNFSNYDAVFFSGVIGSGAANSSVLVQYVESGGAILIMAGTGDQGSAVGEANSWNTFLSQFGLGFGDSYFVFDEASLLDIPIVTGAHPINQSLESISWGNGQLTLDLDPASNLNSVVVRGDFSDFGGGPQGELNDIIAVYRVSLPGDVNLDGIVDLLDVAPFVELLTSGGFQAEADTNQDGVVDLLDVQPFVDLLNG